MFILSKLLTFLLNPMLWVIFFLLWGLFTKKEKRKKKCYITAVALLFFFSNPFIIKKLILLYQAERYDLKPGEVYSAGILLGGFSGMNKTDNKTYFNENGDRFIQTAELYKTGHIKKIIVAAGDASIINKNDFREADFAQQQLVNLGIPPADIWIDRDSRNTAENAVNAKKIIDSVHLTPPFLLITSAIHLPRAQKTFTKAGVTVRGYPCAFMVTPFESYAFEDYVIPSGGAMKNWSIYLREVVGMLMYKLTGKG
ncbi:MAG: YdcF family protein [Agriterribacter sp.]